MSTAQIVDSIASLQAQRQGFQSISLSEMDTSAATVILAGSKVEAGGALFRVTSNETPNASSWTAIATANTAWLSAVPSGSAGSQIFTAHWTSTAPVWVATRGGWYTSAGSVIRHIGGCYKNGAASYQNKFVLGAERVGGVSVSGDDIAWNPAGDAEVSYDLSAELFKFNKGIAVPSISFDSGAINVITSVFEIGVWDMDLTPLVTIDTGIEPHSVVAVKVSIFHDAIQEGVDELPSALIAAKLTDEGSTRWIWNASTASAQSTIVTLQRTTSGQFDGAAYNDAVINRGYLTVWHV